MCIRDRHGEEGAGEHDALERDVQYVGLIGEDAAEHAEQNRRGMVDGVV